MKNKIYLLLSLLITISLSSFADNDWSFNPYDYQYDMTAYVKLEIDGVENADLGNYDVAAFIGEECRGIMEVKEAAGNQYGYLRIRSNSPSGEVVNFKIVDKLTGSQLRCVSTLDFVSDTSVGFPSSPLVIKGLNQYKISFVVDGNVSETYQYFGDPLQVPDDPVKEGHEFIGWDPQLVEVVPAEDLTFTALFKVLSYTASFYIDGEKFGENIVEYATPIVTPDAPEKEGYTFAGWQDVPETMPANDIEIVGSYTVNHYKLTYVVDGNVYKEYTVAYGEAITPEAVPVKEGFVFSGWDNVPSTMPAHDVTVSGSFLINAYQVIFKIDGEIIATKAFEYGSVIELPSAPEKEGYTFAGWQDVPETMPAHDIEIVGSYTVNHYKLTYVVDGNVYKEYTVAYGEAITPEAVPVKEGFVFSGWDNVPSTMPAHDVTVSGSFLINAYQVIFKIDGEIIATKAFEYGSVIELPSAPEKEGYTFAGWQDVPETMPAHDIEIVGSYTVNHYKLTYVVDGNVYKEYTVAYGEAITPEAAPVKEGFVFSGWDNVPTTMPAHDVTVSGSFLINAYQVVFKIDGEVIATKAFEYGSEIELPAAPEREGYTFAGWQDVPETMPAHDIEILGSYTVNHYKLTYVVDGNVYKEYTVAYGTAITPEAAPVKEGFVFSGWDNVPTTMPAHDVTVAGSFLLNAYQVVFKIDGEIIATKAFEYGSVIELPSAPEKEGYTFAGWQDVPETMPAHDIEIVGSYTVNHYKLTYVVDGNVYKEYTVAYGEAITPEAAPVKEGFVFSGWDNVPTTMPAHDVTVSGSFLINAYQVVFKIDGEVIATKAFEYGSEIELPAAPEREGYTFAGWQDVPETMPAHDIEILGSYTVNHYKLTYVVDGNVYKEYTVAYGTAITPEAAPVKEGFVFSGWDNVPTTMPAHDVTVAGSFLLNAYQVVFKIDGEIIATKAFEYGSEIELPAAPEKEGYTFSGWQDVPETMPAHDLEIVGSYTVNHYKLTYVVDGNVYKEYTVAYGEAITPEAAPVKEGFVFSGWDNVPATMPAHDVTVSGLFLINAYQVVFKIDGEIIATKAYEYGSEIELPAAPEKEGYTFAGWQDVPEIMPAHDIEIVGSYTVNYYKLTYVVDGNVYKEYTVAYGEAITPEAAPVK
ncbi:MAG: InlB B-repeat-containing protein, partial [Muribaculaceae bacterium]|nr:InlB B-repeat-containing protein [Muribaculaceae bacterium]